jgi:hypothetical protein
MGNDPLIERITGERERIVKNAKALVLLIALVLTVAACGGQSAEEELLEQLLESGDSGISDIDIDPDSGEINISVEGEDGGDVSISGSGEEDDFSMVIEGEDGEVMTFGTGDLPEGLLVPVPDGGKIIQTLTSGEDIMAMLEYAGSEFDQLVSVYDGAMGGSDVQRNESTFSNEDGTVRSVNWYADNLSLFVTVADCYSTSNGELESVCLTINQSGS